MHKQMPKIRIQITKKLLVRIPEWGVYIAVCCLAERVWCRAGDYSQAVDSPLIWPILMISSLPCFVVRLFLCASVVRPSRSHSSGNLQWLIGEVWGGWGVRGRPQSQWQLQECRGRKQQSREMANRQEPYALRHLEAYQVSDGNRDKIQDIRRV